MAEAAQPRKDPMTRSERLRARLAEALQREMKPREVLHWSGQPCPRAALWHVFYYIPFGLGWIATFIYFPGEHVLSSLSSPYRSEPLIFSWELVREVSLFLLPFMVLPVLIGCFMVARPFWAAWRAKRTIHAITHRRMITIVAGRKIRVKSAELAQSKHVRAREWRNGIGELTLIRDYKDEHLNLEWEAIPDVLKLKELVVGLNPALGDRY